MRELVNRVQRLRKQSGLVVTDFAEAFFEVPEQPASDKPDATTAAKLLNAFESGASELRTATKCAVMPLSARPKHAAELGRVEVSLHSTSFAIQC